MERVWETIILMLASMLKFVIVPPMAISDKFFWEDYSFWETIFITSAGGCIGVIVFYFFGKWIVEKINKYTAKIRTKKKKIKWFTKTNRWIVKIKSKYGLIGLAIITPGIISIPLGSIIAAKYCRRDARTLPYLLLSVMLWSLILTSVSSLF